MSKCFRVKACFKCTICTFWYVGCSNGTMNNASIVTLSVGLPYLTFSCPFYSLLLRSGFAVRYVSGVSVQCQLILRSRRYLSVCPPLVSGTCPLYFRLVRSTSGRCPIVTRVYRTPTYIYRPSTGDVTDEYRSQRRLTDT